MLRSIRAIIAVVDKASAPLRAIQQRAAQVFSPLRQGLHLLRGFADRSGLTGIWRGVERTGESVARLGQKLRGLVSPLTAVLSLAGLFTLGHAMQSSAAAAEHLLNAAAKVGVAVEQYQALAYGAEAAGIEQATFDQGLVKLTGNLAKAVAGKNKDLAALLKALGIRAADADGKLRPMAELLPELAEAFRVNEDPALRLRMAMALGGEEFTKLLPLLAEGREGLDRYARRAEELGAVVGRARLERLAAFGDTAEDLGHAVRSLGTTIFADLAPVLGPVVADITAWVAANREIIAQKVAAWAEDVVAALRSYDWRALWQVIKDIAAAIGDVVDFLGGWEVAAIALAAVMKADLLLAIGGVAKALGSLALIVVSNPLGVLLAAIAAAAALIVSNWSTVVAFFEGMWESIKSVFQQAWAWIDGNVIQPILAAVEAIRGAVREVSTGFGLWGDDAEQGAADLGEAAGRGASVLRHAVERPSLVRMAAASGVLGPAVAKFDGELKARIQIQSDRPYRASVETRGPVDADLPDTGLSGLAYP